MADPFDNRGSDPTWHSGLKTIQNTRRSRSAPRWDIENSKTIENKPERIPYEREGKWVSGLKVVGDRYAPHPTKAQLEQRSDEWQGVHKTLDNPSTHYNYKSTWHTENFKVLPPKEERVTSEGSRQWHSGLYKTLNRGRAAVEPPAPSGRTGRMRSRSAKLPSDGSWATENFKVLEGEDSSSARYRSYASQSRTGVPRFEREGEWCSGLKTVDEERTHYETNGWLSENGKILPSRERCLKQYDITGTGWDSGLYKTIPPNDSRISPTTDWSVKLKTIAREEQRPRRRYEIIGTGWDSGLKTLEHKVASPKRHVASTSDKHWDIQNRKTMPLDVVTTSNHVQEYNRHVREPRRRDMQAFHQKLCSRHVVHAF